MATRKRSRGKQRKSGSLGTAWGISSPKDRSAYWRTHRQGARSHKPDCDRVLSGYTRPCDCFPP